MTHPAKNPLTYKTKFNQVKTQKKRKKMEIVFSNKYSNNSQ